MFESKINRGRAGGYAPLDAEGKVPLDKTYVGANGTAGTSGADGSFGTDGSSGTSGSTGTSGSSGSSGSSGTSGSTGFDGAVSGRWILTGGDADNALPTYFTVGGNNPSGIDVSLITELAWNISSLNGTHEGWLYYLITGSNSNLEQPPLLQITDVNTGNIIGLYSVTNGGGEGNVGGVAANFSKSLSAIL